MSKQVIQKAFKRVETKYIVDKAILAQLEKDLTVYMRADDYAHSTITNIYFDNSNFDMIQDAIAKKGGREKVRMRLYDKLPTAKSTAFLEIKKKEAGVGFKYRMTASPKVAEHVVTRGLVDNRQADEQVLGELEGLRARYGTLYPMMYIYYERSSYKGREDKDVRVTIDQNLLYRDHAVGYQKGRFGQNLLDPKKAIIEIKVPDVMPDWLAEILAKYDLEQGSFSKYGTAYRLSKQVSKEDVYLARQFS